MVLALAECEFLDTSGFWFFTKAAGRFATSGGQLVMRSPSVIVARILDITGLDIVAPLEPPKLAPDHLGPEQLAAAPEEISQAPRQPWRVVASAPAADDMLDSALRFAVALAGAAVAAIAQDIVDVDADQYSTVEGPCIDASTMGRWVRSSDTEIRRTDFSPRAVALGRDAIPSSPLLVQNQPEEALNIFSRTTEVFAPKAQELAAVFATEVSTILATVGLTEDRLSVTATRSPMIGTAVELADLVPG